MNDKHFDVELVDFSEKQELVNGKLLVQTRGADTAKISDIMWGHTSHTQHSSE